jgi:hypothetical protein
MFYKGELDGLLAGNIVDLPLMLAVSCRLGWVVVVGIHGPIFGNMDKLNCHI